MCIAFIKDCGLSDWSEPLHLFDWKDAWPPMRELSGETMEPIMERFFQSDCGSFIYVTVGFLQDITIQLVQSLWM